MMETKGNWWNAPIPIYPLITFRILFGLIMTICLIRFWYFGWIKSLYIEPAFHFTYQGFHWVEPLGEWGMYAVFIIAILSVLCITIGFLYRIATILFFISFTYIELIDVATYLNHYVFISLCAFILIWLPANVAYSIDVTRSPKIYKNYVPRWTIDILKFQIAMVYIFAGLAKINTDWLLRAEPMLTWLPAKSYLPIIGSLFYQKWVAYFFSWFGFLYDTFIIAFLIHSRSRPIAFIFILLFHFATAILFPSIGMFPYIMIASSFIFFSSSFHENILRKIFFQYYEKMPSNRQNIHNVFYTKIIKFALIVFILFQILIPLRFLLYPGTLFWTEAGYRFSWRVMLMEKAGVAYFKIKDKLGTTNISVDNQQFLTPLQEKMMCTQPDLILQFAHFLASHYDKKGIKDPQVFSEVYVSLNGRKSKLFIDSTVNLAQQPFSYRSFSWILPFSPDDK